MLTSLFPSNDPTDVRPARLRAAALAVLCAVGIFGLTACDGGSSGRSASRPHTDARLVIVSPTPNEVTAATVPVQFQVQGAIVSPPQKNKLTPNEGHIHVTVDGRLVAMAYGTSTTLSDLKPGTHTLQAEFVANDHLPFSDRIIQIVIFTVKA